MPVLECDSLSRTSSALFFKLGVESYARRRHHPQAADREVEGRLDHYLSGDRTQALERAKRLFKRCIRHQGDLLAGSAVWHGTQRCLQRRVPDFAKAQQLTPLYPEADWEALLPTGAVGGLDAATFERYARTPALRFLRSLDFRALAALGVCQTCSAQEVGLLHTLCKHPAFPKIVALVEAPLDAAFADRYDADADVDADADSEAGSTTDAVDGDEAASDAEDSASETEGANGAEPEDKLRQILLALGLDKKTRRQLAGEIELPAGSPPDAAAVAEALDAVAQDYVDHVTELHTADLAGEDLDGLLDLLNQPQGRQVWQDWEMLVKSVVASFADLLVIGMEARSRKRMRDDATDCGGEVV